MDGHDATGLFEPDANHVRNAAAHVHWSYLPATDEIELVDQGWTRRLRNVEAYRLLRRMIDDAVLLMDVHKVLTGPRMRRLVSDAGALRVLRDPTNERLDEALLKRTMGLAFQRLTALGWAEP